MSILKTVGQLFLGVLITFAGMTIIPMLMAFTPDNLRLFVGLLFLGATGVLIIYLWRHFRLLFWGCLILPILSALFFLFIVVFAMSNKVKTGPAELTKNGANYDYSKLTFSGVWVANIPEGGIFEFAHPAYLGRKEIKVNGEFFRYVSEERYPGKDAWKNTFTAIYDGKIVYRDPDPLANPQAVAPHFKDPQYWREAWEFHPKGRLLRTKIVTTIAGREAVRFETKSLFGRKEVYWVDALTGVVLKDESGYECQEINYAPVDKDLFKKPLK